MMTSPFTHIENPATPPQNRPTATSEPAFSTPNTDHPAKRPDVDPQIAFSQTAEQTPRPAPIAFDTAPGFKEPR